MNELRIEPDYLTTPVRCLNCGKEYVPAQQKALEELKVPALFANNFCSRKCKDIIDQYLQDQRANQ